MDEQKLDELKWVMEQIRERMNGDFYGELVFKMQHGRIIQADIKQTKKPPKG